MYQLQNIDYLYRISTMTGSSKLVTVQADRDSHDLNDKHFVMLNLCRAIVNFANEGHVISAVYELEPDGTSKRVAYRGLPEYQEALKDPEPDVIVAKFATNFSSGAALPCLAQIMWNDIHASLNKTEHCSNCPDLRILVGQNTDKDGHELCFFIPFGGTEFDHDERIRCAHAARVVENYLDNVAYGKKVETYIRGLVEAASIDGTISESNTEV